MFASEPRVIAAGDEAVDAPAVFALHRADAPPYLGRTALLRRRLKRLLRIRGLRESVERIEYWPTSSRLESSFVLYGIAKRLLPDRYVEFLKLRMPPYVKLVLSNIFPRTQITSKLSARGTFFGPFRTRATAEVFEKETLDLFQLRRCQEDLAPAPDHPGCIYGEMGMCLRPCQQLVGVEEYATEAARITEFLRTGGKSALHSAVAARDRLSAEMEFEAAARQHKRVEKIEELFKSRDELARDLDMQYGVAVTPGHEPESVLLWILAAGWWREPVSFPVSPGQSVSMDQRLREIMAGIRAARGTIADRQEHMALLARWYYSSWRDGAWIAFDNPERAPYRRIVAAISRTVHQNSPAASH